MSAIVRRWWCRQLAHDGPFPPLALWLLSGLAIGLVVALGGYVLQVLM